MKRVTFEGAGDFELTLQADFSDAEPGQAGNVRLQVDGLDVENFDTEAPAVTVYGWYSPAEAREIARYLNEMADKAEAVQP